MNGDGVAGSIEVLVATSIVIGSLGRHLPALSILQLGTVGDTVTQTTANGTTLDGTSLGNARVFDGLEERWDPMTRHHQ